MFPNDLCIHLLFKVRKCFLAAHILRLYSATLYSLNFCHSYDDDRGIYDVADGPTAKKAAKRNSGGLFHGKSPPICAQTGNSLSRALCYK
jgi:hypothetical protein